MDGMDRTARRFEQFTDAELGELWDGLTMDDGIRYGIEGPRGLTDAEAERPENFPDDFRLACELHAEAEIRGLDDADPDRWRNVLA